MASTLRSNQRQRPSAQRRPLGRTGSSFLGTIKNIVTAPLSWFSASDDFEDTKDPMGKRRRLITPSVDGIVNGDERSSRHKRMRVNSPPRDTSPPQAQAQGYLDPPSPAFEQANRLDFSSKEAITRSASISVQPLNDLPQSGTLARVEFGRTMSIDPPSRPLSRTSTGILGYQLIHDISMEPSFDHRKSITREHSMPPLSSRPSFRMRTSLTPQPQLGREVSEPPPITSLISNPTFVRAPSLEGDQRQGTPRQPALTLGTLVESVRSSCSPARQHSALFGTASDSGDENRPAEKALQELDIYKTPLVPTRLRAVNSVTKAAHPSSNPSDLFKSRRRTQLVLMRDEKEADRYGRKASSKRSTVNETKPYAGEGGMKRLLARRKSEVEKDVPIVGVADQVEEAELLDNAVMDQANVEKPGSTKAIVDAESSTEVRAQVFLPPSRPSSSSSLRVGRTKTRNHITRPTIRPKTKFSAAFEDDDDTMDDGVTAEYKADKERKKEQDILEKAARRAPVFNIAEGFSFANVKPIEHDLTNAKEPPRASLPFSFKASGPASAQVVAKPIESLPPLPPSTTEAMNPPSSSDVTPFRSGAKVSLDMQPKAPTIPLVSSESGNGGIPNFFANSEAFSKPFNIASPKPLLFSSTSQINLSAVPPTSNAEVSNDMKETSGTVEDSATQVAPLIVSNPVSDTKTSSGFTFSPSPGLQSADKPSLAITELKERKDFNTLGPKSSPVASTPATTELFKPEPSASGVPQQTEPLKEKGTVQSAVIVDGRVEQANATAPPAISRVSKPVVPTDDAKLKSAFPIVSGSPKPLLRTGFVFESASTTSNTPTAAETGKATTATPFAFGPPSSSTSQESTKGGSAFTFGNPPSSTTSTSFPFSSSSATARPATTSFSFGSPSTTTIAPTQVDRPVTPPKLADDEVKMDESPTRDVQTPSKPAGSAPSLSGFSFNVSAPTSIFASQNSGPVSAPSTTPFTFGATPTSTTPSPLLSDNKPFTFGAGTQSTANTLAPKVPETAKQTGPSTSSFSFGSDVQTTSSPVFTFGATPGSATSSPFGQAMNPSGSTSSIPSPFGQSSPFSFKPPLPSSATSFTFGASQPTSPASANTGLPQISTTNGFGGGSGAFPQAQPASPFSPSTPTATGATGGALFTIGAAPAPSPVAGRQIRKLPTRRGGVKR